MPKCGRKEMVDVDYRELWYSLYEHVLGNDKRVKRLMEDMDPNLVEEEPADEIVAPGFKWVRKGEKGLGHEPGINE
jgi:hypothetical protein